MSYENIIYEADDRVATITFTRPCIHWSARAAMPQRS